MANVIEKDGSIRGPRTDLIVNNDDKEFLALKEKNEDYINSNQLSTTLLKHLSPENPGKLLSFFGNPSVLTSFQLGVFSNKFASYLAQAGFQSSTTLVIMNNCPLFFVPVIGSWILGSKVSIMKPMESLDTLKKQFKIVNDGRLVIVCENEVIPKLPELFDSSKTEALIVALNPTEDYVYLNEVLYFEEFNGIPTSYPIKQKEVSLIFWTSGSTGEPKGVQYTAETILNFIHYTSYIPDDIHNIIPNYVPSKFKIMVLTNLYHPGGFFEILRNIFAKGRVGFILGKNNAEISPEDVLSIIGRFKPNMILCYPEFAVKLSLTTSFCRHNLSSVSVIVPIGAPLTQKNEEIFENIFPKLKRIARTYGSTETFTVAKSSTTKDIGSIVPKYSLKVLKENETLVKMNEVGEIAVKPAFGMSGYCGMINDGLYTSDGYFYTGDTGYYDSEGRVYLLSRSKYVINIDNHRVYPEEIECFISRELSYVLDVGITSLADENGNIELAALVVIKNDAKFNPKSVHRIFSEKNVPEYKRLKGGVKTVLSIPRNSNGKIFREKLPLLYSNVS